MGTVILRSQQAVLSIAKEESIVVGKCKCRSFAAAQDDSLEGFFRSL
jgi:hypothetical protein